MTEAKDIVAKESNKRREGSQARPGVRRVLQWSVRSGKLMALAALLIAGWLLANALTSDRYVVSRVQAEGIQALSQEDVRLLADVIGQPIWFIDHQAIEERVRHSPYVEQVRAQVRLPDQVLIRVVERRPEVRWLHDGAAYAVTQAGLILAAAPGTAAPAPPAPGASAPPEGLAAPLTISETTSVSQTMSSAAPGPAFVSQIAIVDTTPNRRLKPGDRVDPDALEVARRVILRSAELPVELQRIEWDAGLGVSLRIADKQAVIGKSERLDEKLALLNQLLRDGTAFAYLDLRTTTPYYR